MNVEELRRNFPDEASCRAFFESVIWPDGPVCPHCHGRKVWAFRSPKVRAGLYECADCAKQFTVTTKTAFHGTKLSLWIWLQAMYSLIFSSKGASSVFMAQWLGISQKSAWKMLHALRTIMAIHQSALPKLQGIVELDEKYLGGKPRYQPGVKHKRGRGTQKSCIAVAVQRQGPVRATLVTGDSVSVLRPLIQKTVSLEAHLMSDELRAYGVIGQDFAAHETVQHGRKEFARGVVHNNTAESYNALLERAKQGVYHWMSKLHLPLYISEAAFRWNQRVPDTRTIQRGKNRGKVRITMKPLPLLDQFKNLLRFAPACQVRRSKNSGIRHLPGAIPLFGL